jgi:hypothetical protein
MSQIIKCSHCNKAYFEIDGQNNCPFCNKTQIENYDWFKDFFSGEIFKGEEDGKN